MAAPFRFKHAVRGNPFAAMPTGYLLNNYAIFRAIRSDFVFARHERLLAAARAGLGDRAFFRALKATMGRQFTCGERVDEASAVVRSLTRAGFKVAVNYMAEFDQGETREEVFDANAAKYLESVELCAAAQPPAFVAIKLSGLVDFKLLRRASELQERSDALFLDCPAPAGRPWWRRAADLAAALGAATGASPAEAAEFLGRARLAGGGELLHFAEWRLALNFHNVAHPALADHPLPARLFPWSPAERAGLERLAARVREIADRTLAVGAALLMDAEQSYFFAGITALVEQLMLVYNVRRGQTAVFNTVQAYLRRSRPYIEYELSKAELFGADYRVVLKLVRGAYIVEERLLEAAERREIVHASKADTDANYDDCAALILSRLTPPSAFILATHNELSAESVVERLNAQPELKRNVVFGTLYGLSDYMAYCCLGEGLLTMKYLPYGESDITLPYLLRRGIEARKTVTDDNYVMSLLRDEIKSRTFGRFFGAKK